METGINDNSDSSSSSSDKDESESTATTATCNDLMPIEETPTFNGIGTVNMDNCQESHFGPKIITDNLNIILNNPEHFGIIEDVIKRIPYKENRDWDGEISCDKEAKNMVTDNKLSAPLFNRKYKKQSFSHACIFGRWKVLVVCSGILMLVTAVGTTAVLLSRKPRDRGSGNGNSTISTTTSRDSTTTSRYSTSTSRGSTTTNRPSVTTTTWPVTQPTGGGDPTIQPTSQFYTRDKWNGMTPPFTLRYSSTKRYIALDNLQGNHCASLSTCETILMEREKDEHGSLNYNFLIDDSGNVYEARGWDYKPDLDVDADTTVKVAFIGSYSDRHLTASQIMSFRESIQNSVLNVLDSAEMEAQCCRATKTGSVSGPDENVVCDIQGHLGFVKAKLCTNCRWVTGHICGK